MEIGECFMILLLVSSTILYCLIFSGKVDMGKGGVGVGVRVRLRVRISVLSSVLGIK